MTTDEFLFRDDYTVGEKIRRIPEGKITGSNPEIQRCSQKIGLSGEEINKIGKHDFFDEAEAVLSDSRYKDLVHELFEEYGKKGDKFNMQLFSANTMLSLDTLSTAAEDAHGSRLDKWIYSLNEPIVLTDYKEHSESIDLQFRTSVRREDIEPDENIPIQIIRREDGEVVEKYGDEYTIRAPARYRVETRVYPESGYIAVSNYSQIGDGLQTAIADTILELIGSGKKPSRLDLNETELLLLQQEMEGNVSGLGYTLEIAGVDTADISGTRDEDMFGTHVVRAADESGQIRKIKFYVDYRDEDAVMLRIFDDGHLTTSKPVQTQLLDAVVDEIETIRSYEGFLIPLSELVYSYVQSKFRGRPTTARTSHISKTHDAFSRLIERNLSGNNTPMSEQRLHLQ